MRASTPPEFRFRRCHKTNMRTVLVLQVIAAALLAAQPPLAILDGRCTEVHEIPRFVRERVELPYGASGSCPHSGSRGTSCLALGVPGAGPENGACLPGD
jgi:hypothetical protein